MREIIMGYQGEMSLKGLNRNQFESAMMKILRYRLKTVGKFKVYCTQSTFYMEPEEEDVDMDLAFDRVRTVFGLAAAATRLAKTMKSRDTAMRALNQRLRDGLAAFPEVVLNSPDNAVPEVLNFSENCIKSETMLAHLAQQQVYVSSASACGRGQPSHTLAAMGRDPLAIDTAIRVSFCADNTPEDVDAFLNAFEDGMKHLQRIKK